MPQPLKHQVLNSKNMRLAVKAGVLAAFLGFLPAGSTDASVKIPVQPDGYVTDRAGMLSPSVRTRLEERLQSFEKQTTSQVLVATFPALEGESLEDFSIKVAEAWKPGQKSRDNGVIVLIFRDEHKIRIEVGYGLEGVLTDAVSAQIIREIVAPAFRAGNFDQGVEEGVRAILQAIRGEYKALPAEANHEGDGLLRGVATLLVLVLALDLIRYFSYWSGHRSYSSRYGFWEWFFLFSLLWFILRMLMTSRGGYSGQGGGWSSGGYSGGGGRFGGGGASGGW